MCICVSCVCSAAGDQKRASHPLEMELLVFGAAMWVLRIESDTLEQPMLLTLELSLQPLHLIF